MNPTIKARIESIRCGEVPEGYKKAKVGIVPEEWNYEKLGKHLIQYHEISKYNNQYPVLTSSRKGIFLQADYYNREVASEDNTGYNVVPRGYFTYRHMSDDEIFKFNINTIVDKGIVSTLYPVFTAKNINNYFLQVLLNEGREFRSYAILQKQGGSRTYMYFDKLKQLKVCLPPLAEQEKIAEILQTQDKVIELQQKKIEELKRLKKVYLSKMFPKKGCNVPEIRFPGFTDPWEQREFGDVFVEYSEKNHEELPPLTIIQGKGTILREESDRNLIYDKSGLRNYKLVNQGDFILHLRSFEGGLEVANSRGIVSPAYHLFHSENADSRFYYPFFRSKYFISVLLKPHVYGIRDGKSIDVDGMKSVKIPCPKIEEQKAIGEYFTYLDNLITLYQRKLDEEQKKKKALMQLLLTGIARV